MNRAATELTLEVGVAQHVVHLLKANAFQQQHRPEAEHLPAAHRESGLRGEQRPADLLERHRGLSVSEGEFNDLTHKIAAVGLSDGTQTTVRL